LGAGPLRLLRQVPFQVVAVVPGAVARQAVARAGGVARVGAVAGAVVGEVVGAVAGELVGGVVAVAGRGAVVGLGGQAAARVVAPGVGGQGRARAVVVHLTGHAADGVVQVRGRADLARAGQVAVARLGGEQAVVLVGQVDAQLGRAHAAELARAEAVVGVIAGGLE